MCVAAIGRSETFPQGKDLFILASLSHWLQHLSPKRSGSTTKSWNLGYDFIAFIEESTWPIMNISVKANGKEKWFCIYFIISHFTHYQLMVVKIEKKSCAYIKTCCTKKSPVIVDKGLHHYLGNTHMHTFHYTFFICLHLLSSHRNSSLQGQTRAGACKNASV